MLFLSGLKNNFKIFAIGASALAVSLALCFAILAWSEPGAVPPAGNVGAPVNTSANPQTKAAALGFSSGTTYWLDKVGESLVFKTGNAIAFAATKFIIGSNGNVGIGVAAPAKKLEVAGEMKADGLCLDACCSNWTDCLGE
jgi:hypothetical protein